MVATYSDQGETSYQGEQHQKKNQRAQLETTHFFFSFGGR